MTDERAPQETRIVEPEPSPFGGLGATPRARLLRAGAMVAAVAVAVAGAWWGTRPAANARAADTSHAGHDATPAAGMANALTISAEQQRRIGITYVTAVTGPLEVEVRTVAQVTFDERRVTAIAPKLDGWVEALYVATTGQAVRRGDPLLAIYSPMVVSAQQELILAGRLTSDVAAASAETRGSAADLREAARRRLLNWDVAPADVERIERTGEVQRTIVLRSAASGVVVEKAVIAGQRIMAGETLYRLADLSVVWLEGEVFERDLPLVKVGQAVRAELEALPGQSRLGRIAYIYPTLNPETRTARVRVELPNPGLALKPGMYATLLVRDVGATSSVLVPRSAVMTTGERDLVFVRMADGMLEPREVVLGSAGREHVQVLRGLREGETVVASATFLVDAESNLGSVMGGMGNMPGMDMTPPQGGAPK